jgi:hypothetical protein
MKEEAQFVDRLQELKNEAEALLNKYEKDFDASSELAIVRTKFQEGITRVAQELQKYTPKPQVITPEPATQDPATNGQLGVPDAPGTPLVEETTETPPTVPVPSEQETPSQTTQINVTTPNTNAEGVALNTPSGQPTSEDVEII